MYRFRFVLFILIALIVTALPAGIFAYLKYNGLEDESWAGMQDEEAFEEEEYASCRVIVKFQGFEKTFPSNTVCLALICDKSGCAIQSKNSGEETLYLENAALAAGVTADYKRALLSDDQDADSLTEPSEETGEEEEQELSSRYKYPLWQWLAIFSVAITFSLVGTTTSLIFRGGATLKENLYDDLRGLGVVLFFAWATGIIVTALFAGGLLQGAMFPNFSGDIESFGFNSWSALKFRGQDWFKLAVWCYIAGFYERFLPDALQQLVRKAGEEKTA
ncbi:hypothetical protein HFC70_09070 [Agrobacterium sp. a22-2]|uniref:hypothetical protein n=1 Tax=Agrobacterium sp. a22-2 TaxID=2283840 RepID=UPI00144609F8|nr:hypothetical protein [Agrobacterium sp. a22-2]NKN36506.1 hypothetical protein [Agrobacterium sp. a22-2]